MNNKCTVLEDIATLGKNYRGEEKKLIKAKWNTGAPVYEIRTFTKDGKPARREGLSKSELLNLRDVLNNMKL